VLAWRSTTPTIAVCGSPPGRPRVPEHNKHEKPPSDLRATAEATSSLLIQQFFADINTGLFLAATLRLSPPRACHHDRKPRAVFAAPTVKSTQDSYVWPCPNQYHWRTWGGASQPRVAPTSHAPEEGKIRTHSLGLAHRPARSGSLTLKVVWSLGLFMEAA